MSQLDASRVRMLPFLQNHLQDQGLFSDDGSFCHTSISYQDCQIFAQDPDNTNRVRQEELPGFDDFTFSSNAHPLEDNLTSNIDENPVEDMTTIEFEDNSSCINEEDSVESLTPQAKDAWRASPDDLKVVLVKSRNSDQSVNSDNNNHSDHSYKPVQPPFYARKSPTHEDNLSYINEEDSVESFATAQERISPQSMMHKRIETSSEDDLPESSSHYSNGEGGPPDPYQDSSSTMGGST